MSGIRSFLIIFFFLFIVDRFFSFVVSRIKELWVHGLDGDPRIREFEFNKKYLRQTYRLRVFKSEVYFLIFLGVFIFLSSFLEILLFKLVYCYYPHFNDQDFLLYFQDLSDIGIQVRRLFCFVLSCRQGWYWSNIRSEECRTESVALVGAVESMKRQQLNSCLLFVFVLGFIVGDSKHIAYA